MTGSVWGHSGIILKRSGISADDRPDLINRRWIVVFEDKIDHYLTRPHYYLARDYARLGDHETSLAELSHSYQNHDLEILWILTDPDMDSLRLDPRFHQLLKEIGFPN